MPRFAANLTMMFGEEPFLDRFAAAARAGFKAVEVQNPYDVEAQDQRRRLDEHALAQVLINTPPADGGYGLAAAAGRGGDFHAGIERAVAVARELGCPRIHIVAGPAAGRGAEDTFVANLRHAAEMAAPHGIRCLIEPLNDRDNPGYVLTRTEDARRILDRVACANVRLQFDFYHRQIMQGDLAEALRAHIDAIDHVQIAGVPGRHEPDVGEIAYPFLFDLLDELGYDGWVGCEYRPRARTLDGLAWARPWGIGVR
jgi:hydroxypyruvate isomerase